MQISDSPQNRVLLVNAATPDEESGIEKELGIMVCRRPGLRVVGHDTESIEGKNFYKMRTHSICHFSHLGC